MSIDVPAIMNEATIPFTIQDTDFPCLFHRGESGGYSVYCWATNDGRASFMTFALLGLGFVLGLKHALDADHLAAISTIVSQRKTIASSAIAGTFWGIGHTFSLLVVGVFVLALGLQVPHIAALAMEFSVALMLVGLGANVLRKILKGERAHAHAHHHGGITHTHPHFHQHAHDPAADGHHRNSWRVRHYSTLTQPGKSSLLIGMVHGMAGSAGLMLLVASTISSFWVGILYILVFGAGSIGGMLTMSTVMGLPFVLSDGKLGRINIAVQGMAGVASMGFGLFLAWEIGFVEGLFF